MSPRKKKPVDLKTAREVVVQDHTIVRFNRLGCRVFVNFRGVGYYGQAISATIGGQSGVFIANPRRKEAGLRDGMGDLIGWYSFVITPDMVGRKVAIFLAPELKRFKGGTVSDDQYAAIGIIRAAGGIAGVIKEPDDADRMIEEWRNAPSTEAYHAARPVKKARRKKVTGT